MGEKARNSHGFTLVEVLIVMSVIGLIMTALSAAFVVIVRSNPTNEQRADDTRALLSLTRWLPDDVASTYTYSYDVTPTAANGFTVDGSDPQCRSAAPPAEVSLLNLRWHETSTTYFVDYFWVRDGSVVDGLEQGRIMRFSCYGTSSGPTSSVETLTMSVVLSEVPAVPAWPVDVAPVCPRSLQNPDDVPPQGDPNDPSYDPAFDLCSIPNAIPGGVMFDVSLWNSDNGVARDLLELVAVSKNVQGPPVGTSTGTGSGVGPGFNEPPVAGDLSVEMYADTSEIFDLPVYDYDGTLDRLVVTTDVTLLIPLGWAAEPTTNNIDPHVEITVPVGAALGPHQIPYVVQDRDGGDGHESATATITVTVIEPPDTPDPPVVNLPIPPPPPCIADFASPGAVPNPVELKKANNNPSNDVNVLNDNVDLEITRSGACDPLVVRFIPDSETGVEYFQAFLNSLETTIRKNDYVWRVGDRVLALYELKDGPDVLHDTLTLTVVPAS